MIVRDILASTYVLVNNASEEELPYPVVLEQFASLITMMRYERILGNVEEVITKGEVTFAESDLGIKTNSLSNFGDVVYLEFNTQAIDECPVNMLDLYSGQGVQRAAFFTSDTVLGTKKIQLSIPQTGTLKVWYEPEPSILLTPSSTVDIQESLKWCIATRLSANCIQYINFKDPDKQRGLPVLALTLTKQASDWKNIYLERLNKIGTDRPYRKLPFMARNAFN